MLRVVYHSPRGVPSDLSTTRSRPLYIDKETLPSGALPEMVMLGPLITSPSAGLFILKLLRCPGAATVSAESTKNNQMAIFFICVLFLLFTKTYL